jgi:hypothetical protein
MNLALVENDPSPMKLEVLGAEDWPLVIDSIGSFERTIDSTEISYIIDGEAEIVAEGEPPINIKEGDLLTIMPDTQCVWTITKAIQRHCNGDVDYSSNG